MTIIPCPECGHRHEGPGLAGICVGCPCPHRPAAGRGLTAEQVDYLLRAIDASARGAAKAAVAGTPPGMIAPGSYLDGRRDGYEHALRILEELLSEPDILPADNGYSVR